jgi:hypothetical protein
MKAESIVLQQQNSGARSGPRFIPLLLEQNGGALTESLARFWQLFWAVGANET